MDRDQLRTLQAPLKERYRGRARGRAGHAVAPTGELGEGVACSVQTGRALAEAGLHPATGGDGSLLCSGDMLLEALVACAGVTLRAVSTSLGHRGAAGTSARRGRSRLPRDARRRPRRAGRLHARSGSRSISTPTPTRSSSATAPEADRALLRRAPDAGRRASALDHLRYRGDLAVVAVAVVALAIAVAVPLTVAVAVAPGAHAHARSGARARAWG